MTPDNVHDTRTLLGRALRYVLGPTYYWLDILDNQRRPSHGKLMWTVAFGASLIILGKLFHHVFWHHADVNPTNAEYAFLLAYAVITFSLAGGLDSWKSYLKSKGGGTVDAFKDVAEAAEHPGKASDE